MNFHQNFLLSTALVAALVYPRAAQPAPEIDFPALPLNYCANSVHQNPPAKADLFPDQAITPDSSYVIQTEYNSVDWSGSIKKLSITNSQDDSEAITSKTLWDAGTWLNKSSKSHQRKIITYNPATQSTVPFEYTQLPEGTQHIFNRIPNSDQQDDRGVERVSYLQGERSSEISPSKKQKPSFRIRKNILGDIVNSIPVIKGPPAKNITDSDYLPFFQQFEHRADVIYVGANDGMLHAFSADSGEELFAYIPSPLLGKLPALTDPAYQHDFYMDGKIRIDEARAGNAWKTVLTAGMGTGAKGVFALDVTVPGADGAVLFEFTEHDDPDMGLVTTAPIIAKVRNGKNADAADNYGYFMIVPGGYNASNAAGDNFLFLISLDKNAHTPWVQNKNYFKLKITGDNSATNALSAPGLVLNGQRETQLAYAGDVQGNMWRFNFSNGDLASTLPQLLFSATDADNHAQPITTQPTVVLAPGGYMVLFGTGKYIEYADTKPENFISNSFYAIYDSTPTGKTTSAKPSRNELASRTLKSATQGGKAGFSVTGSDFSPDPASEESKKGWYLDFPNSRQSGERSISEAMTAYGSVFFNTFIPEANPCKSEGTSMSYKLDALTGKTARSDAITGYKSPNTNLGTPSLIFTRSNSGERSATGLRDGTRYYSVLNFGNGSSTASTITTLNDMVEFTSGRLSWRELPNWQDLK